MKLPLFAATLIAVGVLAACKKEKSREEPEKAGTCEYAPYTTGSSFTYKQVSIDVPDTLEYTMEVKGDSIVEGKKFRVLEADDAAMSISLFRCGGGDYFQLADASGLTGTPLGLVQTVYLKDSQPLGGTWEEQFPVDVPVIGRVNVTVSYTIVQRGTGKTVLGKAYKDVFGVRMDISLEPLLPRTELSTNYYARGVGLIQLDTDADTTRLATYTIR